MYPISALELTNTKWMGESLVTSSPHPLRFVVSSRTLLECIDPLRKGVCAPHQCPLGSVASCLIYADVHTFQ